MLILGKSCLIATRGKSTLPLRNAQNLPNFGESSPVHGPCQIPKMQLPLFFQGFPKGRVATKAMKIFQVSNQDLETMPRSEDTSDPKFGLSQWSGIKATNMSHVL